MRDEPPSEAFAWTVDPAKAPDQPQYVEIEFEAGGRLHELYFKADGSVIRHELVIPAVIEVPA